MKVSGFTFIRNAIKYDFPIVEAITSILTVCDEFVVAVGNSEDDTLGLIKSIRNDKNISSWKDAMSFRKHGEKLHVKPIDACIYHYGWVKEPKAQAVKRASFEKLWHDDAWVEKNVPPVDEFDYTNIESVERFE